MQCFMFSLFYNVRLIHVLQIVLYAASSKHKFMKYGPVYTVSCHAMEVKVLLLYERLNAKAEV